MYKLAESCGQTLISELWQQAGSDVGAMLTRWGMWQPSLKHNRKPSVLEALIGGLESAGNQHNVRATH